MTDADDLAYIEACWTLRRQVPVMGTEADTAPETPDERANGWRRDARDTGESGA